MAGTGRSKDLPTWYKDMEKDLECPVCLNNILDPPIYVCENMHGLCFTCHEKLKDQGKPCPVCKGQLTNKRCLMVEKMLDKLPKAECIFPECSFKRADHQSVLDHQEDCCHRKVPCGTCGQTVAMSSLNKHLEKQHGVKLLTAQSSQMWTCEITASCEFESFDSSDLMSSFQQQLQGPRSAVALSGVTFYLNAMMPNKECAILWVSYNGPKKDGEKYSYNIEVINKQGGTALSCTKYCVPCDTSRDEVEEEHLGVTITKKLAQKVNMEGHPASDPKFKYKIRFFLAR